MNSSDIQWAIGALAPTWLAIEVARFEIEADIGGALVCFFVKITREPHGYDSVATVQIFGSEGWIGAEASNANDALSRLLARMETELAKFTDVSQLERCNPDSL